MKQGVHTSAYAISTTRQPQPINSQFMCLHRTKNNHLVYPITRHTASWRGAMSRQQRSAASATIHRGRNNQHLPFPLHACAACGAWRARCRTAAFPAVPAAATTTKSRGIVEEAEAAPASSAATAAGATPSMVGCAAATRPLAPWTSQLGRAATKANASDAPPSSICFARAWPQEELLGAVMSLGTRTVCLTHR